MQAGGSGFESLSLHHNDVIIMAMEPAFDRDKEWVCTECGVNKVYEKKEQDGEEWICDDCKYKTNLMMWEQFICPIMNRYRTKRDAVRCFTVQCAAFERDVYLVRCKFIDYEHFMPGAY